MTDPSRGDRPWFVAESYSPRPDVAAIRAAALRTRRVAAGRSGEAGVRLIRCTLAPADELCAWLFEAGSEEAVRDVGAAAGLEFERVGRAIVVWPRRRRTPAAGAGPQAT